jgi:hypothetical protein
MAGRFARIAAVTALVGVVMAAAPIASASDEDVIRRGECSGRSDWKLKVGPEDGRLEVEFEVDSNVNGQTWRVRIFQDGDRIFRGRRETRGPSGSVEVELRTRNRAGTDRFRARAVNLATDEVCVGRVSF